MLKDYSTKKLVDELKIRTGCLSIGIEPYEQFQIITKKIVKNTGPVNILIIED